MPVVAMPDGTQVSFPDTMPADQIKSLISEKFPDAAGGLQQPNPESQISADNIVRSVAQGIPIVGGMVDRFAAGMDALTEPVLGRGSWAPNLNERYAQNLAQEQAHTNAFEQAHPYASTAANLAGGIGSLGALAKTATGARLLGLTGETIPQQAIQGAVSGATMNAADAAVRGENPIQAAETGALVGGVAPVAGHTIGAAASGVARGIKRAIEPFTQAGRETRANQLISEFAGSGNTVPQSSLVAGSEPTLAQATANPGLAGLERQLRNMPGEPGAQFVARDAENAAARNEAYDQLSGNQLSVDALTAARDTAGDAARNAAFTNVKPTDPSPVVKLIDRILGSPAGQRDAVKKALGEIRDKLIAEDGTLQTDPRQLYGVRQAAGDMMKFNNPSTNLASKELRTVQNGLDTVIERGAPGYRQYLRDFASASKPIDVQQLLQKANVTDSKGNVILGKLNSLINRIERMRKTPGANQAKSFSDAELEQLRRLRDDLRMAQNSSLGKAIGSNTVQNLMSGGTLERMLRNQAGSLGAGGLVGYGFDLASGHKAPSTGALGGAIAGGLLGRKFNKADAEVIGRVVEKMLNPAEGNAAIKAALSRNQISDAARRAAIMRATRAATIGARAFPTNGR